MSRNGESGGERAADRPDHAYAGDQTLAATDTRNATAPLGSADPAGARGAPSSPDAPNAPGCSDRPPGPADHTSAPAGASAAPDPAEWTAPVRPAGPARAAEVVDGAGALGAPDDTDLPNVPGRRMARGAPAHQDRALHRRLVAGEAAALGEAYDAFASLVHGLAHRVLADDTAADRITEEVFAHLWAHPEEYDPEHGTLRLWLAGLTHRLAVHRLCGARVDAPADGPEEGDGDPADLARTVRRASAAACADHRMTSMPPPLRSALELAYFKRRDCRRLAADLGISMAETHRRLRLGLWWIATAYDTDPDHLAPGRRTAAPAPCVPSPRTPTSPVPGQGGVSRCPVPSALPAPCALGGPS